ncbi:MAG: tetratricopeptide repeat protein [Bacteroidetes bacterium]|nr:tetratricopeptide repeat protein [Bacteroidota bacterium]
MNTLRLEQLKQLLIQEPDDVFLQYAIAMEYVAANEIKQALQHLQQLLQNHKEYVPAYYQMGKCYEATQHIEEAKKAYQQGLEWASKQEKIKIINEFKEALFLLEE